MSSPSTASAAFARCGADSSMPPTPVVDLAVRQAGGASPSSARKRRVSLWSDSGRSPIDATVSRNQPFSSSHLSLIHI